MGVDSNRLNIDNEFLEARALMIRIARFALALILTISSAGCGEGYRLDPATINVKRYNRRNQGQVSGHCVSDTQGQGFEDFGRYDEMIALIREDHAMAQPAKDEELARLNRERTFLNDAHHLRVVWADYSNGPSAEASRLGYRPSSDHFVELKVYEERPGRL